MAVLRDTKKIPSPYLRPLPGESDELFRAEFLGEVSSPTGAIIQSQEKQSQDATAVQLITGTAASSQEIQVQDADSLQIFAATGETAQEPQASQGAAILAFPGVAEHNQEPQDQDGTAYNGTLIYGTATHEQEPQASTGAGETKTNDQPVLIPVYRARQFVSGKASGRQEPQSQDATGERKEKIGGRAVQSQGRAAARGKASLAYIGKAEQKQRPRIYSMEGRVVSAEDELLEILMLMEVA